MYTRQLTIEWSKPFGWLPIVKRKDFYVCYLPGELADLSVLISFREWNGVVWSGVDRPWCPYPQMTQCAYFYIFYVWQCETHMPCRDGQRVGLWWLHAPPNSYMAHPKLGPTSSGFSICKPNLFCQHYLNSIPTPPCFVLFHRVWIW